MALVLPLHENVVKDKHVESLCFPRLDEGSIPSSSTFKAEYRTHPIIVDVCGGENCLQKTTFISRELTSVSVTNVTAVFWTYPFLIAP